MNYVTLLAIPGLVGGICYAWLLAVIHRRSIQRLESDRGMEPLSTDPINMSRIRVAGVGGLGLVAMALTTAFAIPAIGRAISVGLVLGAVLGGVLIVLRRSKGPMRSSAARPGANTTLAIDAAPPSGRRTGA